jgi:hypothetical protein
MIFRYADGHYFRQKKTMVFRRNVRMKTFISYGSQDVKTAEKIKCFLSSVAIDSFIANDIIKNAKLSDGTLMPDSYKTEISKGMNLAKYVIDKKSIIDFVKDKGGK